MTRNEAIRLAALALRAVARRLDLEDTDDDPLDLESREAHVAAAYAHAARALVAYADSVGLWGGPVDDEGEA